MRPPLPSEEQTTSPLWAVKKKKEVSGYVGRRTSRHSNPERQEPRISLLLLLVVVVMPGSLTCFLHLTNLLCNAHLPHCFLGNQPRRNPWWKIVGRRKWKHLSWRWAPTSPIFPRQGQSLFFPPSRSFNIDARLLLRTGTMFKGNCDDVMLWPCVLTLYVSLPPTRTHPTSISGRFPNFIAGTLCVCVCVRRSRKKRAEEGEKDIWTEYQNALWPRWWWGWEAWKPGREK